MDPHVTTAELRQSLASATPPLLIDVRRREAFLQSTVTLPGALRRDPEHAADWAPQLPPAAAVVVYCVHGHGVSQGVAARLREQGRNARFLAGGIELWVASGGDTTTKPRGGSSRWVTRERPKIDRIACPWLVARFIDPDAEFLYVPSAEVRTVAAELDAVPYDIPDVAFSHVGERCSFDAFLAAYRLADPALEELAPIVRGADTARLELAPQCAGLAAVSLGLSRLFADDHDMLAHGMTVYDALYAWCKDGKSEVHTWNPAAYR